MGWMNCELSRRLKAATWVDSKLEAMSGAERAIDRMLKKPTGAAPNL
jgi:hypothetical protein